MKKDNIFKFVGIFFAFAIVIALGIMVSKNKVSSASMKIKEVSFSEYEELIKKDDFTIVLLASPDCSHCNSYKPFVNMVANEYNLEVYYVNVDDIEEDEYLSLHDNITVLKTKYVNNIPNIPTPTTVLYKKSQEVASVLGDVGSEGFIKFLRDNGVID